MQLHSPLTLRGRPSSGSYLSEAVIGWREPLALNTPISNSRSSSQLFSSSLFTHLPAQFIVVSSPLTCEHYSATCRRARTWCAVAGYVESFVSLKYRPYRRLLHLCLYYLLSSGGELGLELLVIRCYRVFPDSLSSCSNSCCVRTVNNGIPFGHPSPYSRMIS